MIFKTIAFALLFTLSCEAIPARGTQYPSNWRDIEHELDNAQNEIRSLQERLEIQENLVDLLRDHLRESKDENKQFIKGSEQAIESRINSLETALKSVLADLKTLQNHINELSKSSQKDIGHLQTALKSIAGAMGVEEESSTYKVKPGDSLGKIAQNLKISVKELKEHNQLKNDRIFNGQILQIPKR